MADAKICVVCAWRENCQKKYSIAKSGTVNCPDFTRDLSIRSGEKKPPAQGESTNR